LTTQAPDLAELCEAFDLSNPMPFDDVRPYVFRMMLQHLYSKNMSPEKWADKQVPRYSYSWKVWL
jgi:hypothetical protein